jgi:hypothetical protein
VVVLKHQCRPDVGKGAIGNQPSRRYPAVRIRRAIGLGKHRDEEATVNGLHLLMTGRSWVLSLCGALALLAVLSTAARAQMATPAAYPTTPDAADCVVAPKPVEEILTIMATPVAATASPAPFVIPEGEPADERTADAVVATLYQVFACANAGYAPRFASLYTDDFLRDFFAGVPASDLVGFLSAPPQPLPDEQKRVIIRIGEVQRHPDGRAGVPIILDEPDDPRTEEPDYVILARVDGRWLVDEIHEDAGDG